MTTKGSGSYANGFPLTNSTADLATNGAYVVIRPGTHALTVRYWIKDYVTNVEGAITKTYPAFDYEKNDYYDMTANINVKDYDGRQYYQWDAKNNYWNGHEWDSADPWQPVLSSDFNYNVAPGTFYNNEPARGAYAAKNSCKTLPNANEMAWYITNGDPHWDGEELWTTMGHLHKGGMWFRKRFYIPQMTTSRAPSPVNVDMRSNESNMSSSPAQGAPTYKDSYFFLPALGYYGYGAINEMGSTGYYWTSTRTPDDTNWAYRLMFDSSSIGLSTEGCEAGYYVMNMN